MGACIAETPNRVSTGTSPPVLMMAGSGRRYKMPKTYAKLRGRIVEKYGTQKNFEEAANLDHVSFTSYLNGSTGWKLATALRVAELLEIEDEQFVSFFRNES